MEGADMRLYLADRMVRLNVTAEQFFRVAHMWRFGRDACVVKDVADFMEGNEPPPYVRLFVSEIQRKENDHAVQALQGEH